MKILSLVLFAIPLLVQAVNLNIHLVLPTEISSPAVTANQAMLSTDSTGLIDFKNGQHPHITLFLGEVTDERATLEVVRDLVTSYRLINQSEVKLQSATPYQSGTYIMWPFERSADLTFISNLADSLVMSLYSRNLLVIGNRPLPTWIKDIEDPQTRKEKTAYFNTFGSPNVFTQFDPHVTLGCWNENAKTVFETAQQANTLPTPGLTATSLAIAVGTVGKCGSVEKTVATFKFASVHPQWSFNHACALLLAITVILLLGAAVASTAHYMQVKKNAAKRRLLSEE